jgi:hypothetical protein
MFRLQFPRIYDLKDATPDSPACWFCNFEESLQGIPQKKKQLLDIESQLQGLDAAAWDQLKGQLVPLAARPDKRRCWEPLFNKMNQANGYNFLAAIGCIGIHFLEEGPRKTPDLGATLNASKVMCEVKTINISEDELRARLTGTPRGTVLHLKPEFLRKLDSTLRTAEMQMHEYYPAEGVHRFAYVIIKFDDSLHEYAVDYEAQIKAHIEQNPIAGLTCQLDIKPAFYSAMTA